MTSLIEPAGPEETFGPEPHPSQEAVSPAEALIEDPTPEPEPDMFPRSYVEELRQESAKYRTRAKAYDDAFEEMDDDTREAWLEYTALVVKAQKGDQAALDRIQEMFGDEDEDQPQVSPVPEQTPVDYEAMARAAAEQVYAEKEQARIQDEQIQAVRKAGEDLGYKFGTEDYILFVRGANEAAQAGSDDPIAAGDKAVKAYRQAVVEAYLASKGAQAETTTAIPDTSGATPNLATKPYSEDMSDAAKFARVRESALARFQGARG